LVDAGISSFKIEGRAKSVYYLACVVGAYRRAIDLYYSTAAKRNSASKRKPNFRDVSKEIKFLFQELDEKLYHRGYTEGFMFGAGEMAQNLDNSHKTPAWEFCGTIHNANTANEYANTANTNYANVETRRGASLRRCKVFIKVHNTLRVGDRIEIIMPKYDIIKMILKKMVDAETDEELQEAHGGQGKTVVIEVGREVPEFSVVRRLIK